MTELLARAFDEASKLSPEVQDDLARQLLEDLLAESRWGSRDPAGSNVTLGTGALP